MPGCASCGADQPVDARFCSQCGTPLQSACPSCGSPAQPSARFCQQCGTTLGATAAGVDAASTHPVASRRITSVLFGDLVGFTSLSESRDQEDVRELLSRYFEECSRIVARYGGTVEKFIGDAVMAVWGVPTTHEDDAERSVRAGLELVAAAAALGAELGVPELAMRVGIVTGEVAVTVGAELQGMVAGDPVNTASRVQSVAAPGQVWVDETTRLLTSAAISYVDAGAHTLKGKADPMPLWAARAVVAQIGGTARADGLEAPLVGRDRELRMVKELYHRVEETHRPALLLVVGDAGVGKSRLGWEFSKYTDGLSNSCRWHAGKCVSYGEGVAYYALAEAVRSRLETGVGPEADAADPPALIAGGLAAYVDSEADREWLAPRLAALLGSAGSFPREDLFAAWTTFFERVSGRAEPVVMMLDDAQYADDGLVMFVEHLMSVATFPCFVMLLARPELLAAHPDLATNRRATVLNLEQLTGDDMSLLVDGLVEGLPPGVRDELVARSEGVPTFAVETVRALIDRDLVVPRGGTYVLRDPDSLDLAAIGAPASLQALISARLDILPNDQRRVVDRASVAGDSVEPELLAELCPDVPDLEQALAGLVRAQILRVEASRLSSEQGRYQFVQSAVRQVAYGTLSRRERKQAHLDVLSAMLRRWSDELAPVVAQHCMAAVEAVPDAPDVAELNAQAVGFLRQAADRARSLGSPKEAAGHLERALELALDPAVRPGLELDLAENCQAIGRYDESIARARSAQASFAAAGDLRHEALAAAQLSRSLCMGPEEYETAVSEIEPYYRRLKDTQDELLTLASVLGAYRQVLARLGRQDVALGLRQLDIAERLDDQSQIARALMGISVDLLGTSGRLLGVLALEKAVAVARDSHDLVVEAHALGNWSSNLNGVDARRALEVGRQAVDVATRSGNLEWISHARNNQALAQWAVGEWDEVVAALAMETFQTDNEACIGTLVGLVLAARGQDPAATTTLSTHRTFTGYWWTLGRSITQAYAGDPEATGSARAALDEAYEENLLEDDFPTIVGAVMDVALRYDDRDLLAHTTQIVEAAGARPPAGLRGHLALWAVLAAPPEATDEVVEEQYASALREYGAWGCPVYVARAQAAYGVWLTHRSRIDEAEPRLAAARTTYDTLGAAAWLAELDRALSGVTTS
ncbi:MAG TPA: adenylate/guanylate cyclase domain-containing protein [Nocardioides sp.]|uniref:ATP-binding protein n=1 Tax=Nocardioides sp. TaxID=35761 RepID=UPI002F3E25C2